MADLDLAALERLLAAATPGPWRHDGGGCIVQLTDAGQGYPLDYYPDSADIAGASCDRCGERAGIRSGEDAAVAAALRNAAPALIAAARERDRLQRAVGEALGMMHEPDSGPTWPASVDELCDALGRMRRDLATVTAERDEAMAKVDAMQRAWHEEIYTNIDARRDLAAMTAERDEARANLDALIGGDHGVSYECNALALLDLYRDREEQAEAERDEWKARAEAAERKAAALAAEAELDEAEARWEFAEALLDRFDCPHCEAMGVAVDHERRCDDCGGDTDQYDGGILVRGPSLARDTEAATAERIAAWHDTEAKGLRAEAMVADHNAAMAGEMTSIISTRLRARAMAHAESAFAIRAGAWKGSK